MAKYNVFLRDIATGEEQKIDEVSARSLTEAKKMFARLAVKNLGKKQVRIIRK